MSSNYTAGYPSRNVPSRSFNEVLARVGHSFVWEPRDKRLYMFGGLGSSLRPGPDPSLRADLWSLNVTDALVSAQTYGRLPEWSFIRPNRLPQPQLPPRYVCILLRVQVVEYNIILIVSLITRLIRLFAVRFMRAFCSQITSRITDPNSVFSAESQRIRAHRIASTALRCLNLIPQALGT